MQYQTGFWSLNKLKLTHIARSSNGRTTDSESVYLRSNRSLAAKTVPYVTVFPETSNDSKNTKNKRTIT